MKDLASIRERFLRESLPKRLGALAANLARIKSFSDHSGHRNAVGRLVEESKFFIEWAALDVESTLQSELVEIQVQLALWQVRWERLWADPAQREAVAEQAGRWSVKLLGMAGIIR